MSDDEAPSNDYTHIRLVTAPAVLSFDPVALRDFLAAWDIDEGPGLSWPVLALCVGVMGSIYTFTEVFLRVPR